MTPYEAVYKCTAPSLVDYVSGTSSVAAVDSLLTDRSVLLKRLRDHLQHAQTRMRNQANSHRSDVEFAVGDLVYVNFHPYRQSTVAHRKNMKLTRL